jgi:hypothetical protein
MSGQVKRRHRLFSRGRDCLRPIGEASVAPKRERDVREMAATMGHSDSATRNGGHKEESWEVICKLTQRQSVERQREFSS